MKNLLLIFLTIMVSCKKKDATFVVLPNCGIVTDKYSIMRAKLINDTTVIFYSDFYIEVTDSLHEHLFEIDSLEWQSVTMDSLWCWK